MYPAMLFVFCLTVATAAPVPKGAEDKTKAKDPEEAKKAARYKALREGYESQRDSLPKDSSERSSLASDMNLARDIAEIRIGIERIDEPKLKAKLLETWETGLKPQITDSPRRKELFDIYLYELSQKSETPLERLLLPSEVPNDRSPEPPVPPRLGTVPINLPVLNLQGLSLRSGRTTWQPPVS
ncbi:MAG: hypothetical protein J0I06_20990 [Planctomycetes bacterium]|nr:hypothetical protein [Planctomycetota bacterium]